MGRSVGIAGKFRSTAQESRPPEGVPRRSARGVSDVKKGTGVFSSKTPAPFSFWTCYWGDGAGAPIAAGGWAAGHVTGTMTQRVTAT